MFEKVNIDIQCMTQYNLFAKTNKLFKNINEMEGNMERLSVCEEEVYLEICWMSEPPALEDVRSAVNRLGHEWKPQTVSTLQNVHEC